MCVAAIIQRLRKDISEDWMKQLGKENAEETQIMVASNDENWSNENISSSPSHFQSQSVVTKRNQAVHSVLVSQSLSLRLSLFLRFLMCRGPRHKQCAFQKYNSDLSWAPFLCV